MSLVLSLQKVGVQCLCQEIKEFYERSSVRCRDLVGLWQVLGVYMSVTCPQKRLENLHAYGGVCTGTV